MNLAETVLRLREHWTMIFPDAPMPDNKQWALWLLAHDEDEVRTALSVLAMRVITGQRQVASEDLPKFVMGILIRNRNNRKKETQATATHVAVPVTDLEDNRGNRV
jgi:hypothetical protein